MTVQEAIDKMQVLIDKHQSHFYDWKLKHQELRGTGDLILEYSYSVLIHFASFNMIRYEFQDYIDYHNCIITPEYVRVRLTI